MKATGKNLYSWPTNEDTSWQTIEDIVCVVQPPVLANQREQFQFANSDMVKIMEEFKGKVHFN